MKKIFPSYFALSKDELSEMLGNALFIFDANVLLDLYRFSESTKESCLKLLEIDAVKNRCWLPHRSCQEYLKNRTITINAQQKVYKDGLENLTKFAEKLKDTVAHPFISEDLSIEFQKIYTKIKSEMEKAQRDYSKMFREDEIMQRLAKIFDGRVGSAYSDEEVQKIIEEGNDRYNNKIPPGYCDRKDKEHNPDVTSQYGDLIFWKQLMSKAKEQNRGVILICSEKKEDWIETVNGMSLQPMHELINEFIKETGLRQFVIYKPIEFLEKASTYFNRDVSKGTFDELKALEEKDLAEHQKIDIFFSDPHIKGLYESLQDKKIRKSVLDEWHTLITGAAAVNLNDFLAKARAEYIDAQGAKWSSSPFKQDFFPKTLSDGTEVSHPSSVRLNGRTVSTFVNGSLWHFIYRSPKSDPFTPEIVQELKDWCRSQIEL